MGATSLGVASLGLLTTAAPVRSFGLRANSRVVIVGAGAAGLTCAYRLSQAGIACRVFEASGSVGGRIWTLRDYFDSSQIAEHGGEFISTEHVAVRRLADELGLQLVDVNAAQPPGTVETYFVNGHRYTLDQAVRDYEPVYQAIRNDLAAAGDITQWNNYTPAGYMLDHMSVADWLALHAPAGPNSNIGKLIGLACATEYGADVNLQSALNLIYLLGFQPANKFNLAGTDERFHIRGGNDQLTSGLARRLPAGTIHIQSALIALRLRADGSYICSFQSNGRVIDVAADHVVLALPFTTLRRVDLRAAGFDARKAIAINTLGMGTNAKLHLQFTHRLWNALGYDGTTYSDFDYQNTWEVTRAQDGRHGILVDFPGGTPGAAFSAPPHGPAPRKAVTDFLSELEHVYPGISTAWNGRAFLDFWAADPWHHGSYAYYKVGQYTAFAGYEIVRQGNVHFCGEHTSYDFQGFINGAVATGASAAQEILGELRLTAKAEPQHAVWSNATAVS